MQLSPLPDLSSNRRLGLTALAVTLAVAAVLIWRDNDVARTLGDTDDAMRLVLVRDLLHGRGWWDQWIGRLQPPLGTYIHWSRLVDGALASLIWLFERVMSPSAAEYGVRLLWPLAWILPVSACGLAMARSLGGKSAVFVGAILLATNVQLYVQFRPGRIDHHDLQITMAVIAAACSMARGRRTRWAVLAGVAAGFGLRHEHPADVRLQDIGATTARAVDQDAVDHVRGLGQLALEDQCLTAGDLLLQFRRAHA